MSVDTQRGNKITLRKFIPGILLGFLALLVTILIGNIQSVGQKMTEFNWLLFPLVLLATLFNYLLRFVKWHFYLNRMGLTQLAWYESMRLFVAGFPLAMTSGKVGEALKGVWLKQAGDLPLGRGISVVVAERLSDGLAVLFLSTLGVVVYPRYWPGFVIVLGILLASVVIIQFRPVVVWLLALIKQMPIISRIVPGLIEFYEGSYLLFKPWPLLVAVGLGMVSWFGEGLGFYLILTGLGLPAGTHTLELAVFILAFSTIIGAVSTLPGGVGAAEASIAGMLVLLIPTNTALAATATLLIRLATLWFGVLLGLVVWSFSPKLLGMENKP
jgi:uncharacterized protein (TIRG00374 family)